MIAINLSGKNKTGILASILISPIFLWLPLASPVFADATTTCVAPRSDTPGVHRPIGADSALFVYNCTTGLWVSPHYSFDPNTGEYTPLDQIVYTYDQATGEYTYPNWVYDAVSGAYVQQTLSIAQPPVGANVVGGPTPAVTPSDTSAAGGASQSDPTTTSPVSPPTTPPASAAGNSTQAAQPPSQGSNSGSTSSAAPAASDPGSTNSNATNPSTSTTENVGTTNSVTNNLTSQADSGQATVGSNMAAGDATSGNTQAATNVVNSVQSSTNVLGGNTVAFTANINGNVNGNFLLDPTTAPVQGSASPSSASNNNVTLNNTTSSTLTNNLTLGSSSGNASVTNNMAAGNATTGSAATIADVVNIINSAVSSGHSFIGVVNINGNLNGNILIPASFVDQLMAANTPTVSVTTVLPVSVIDNLVNMGIANNVSETAASGNASVTNNMAAGNATSGTATATVTAFNLTGSNIIGSNVVFVFVNVVGGKWVGLIMNAPPGTTAAEIGSQTTQSSMAPTTTTNATNAQIINNIIMSAYSGNASVDHNMYAGNAASGNATDSLDLLNIANSNLIFTNWFGLLFINVFGTWNGNFGLYFPPSVVTSTNPPVTNNTVLPDLSGKNYISYEPRTLAVQNAVSDVPRQWISQTITTTSQAADPIYVPVVMTGYYTTRTPYTVVTRVPIRTAAKVDPAATQKSTINWFLIILVGALYLAFLIADRIYVMAKKRRGAN